MAGYVERVIGPAPERLVKGGRFEFGTFNSQFQIVNPLDADRPLGVNGEWIIRDRYGMVDLSFIPVSMSVIDMNLLVLRVKYFGPFGYCSGTVKDRSGHSVVFDQYFGMGEKKYIRG